MGQTPQRYARDASDAQYPLYFLRLGRGNDPPALQEQPKCRKTCDQDERQRGKRHEVPAPMVKHLARPQRSQGDRAKDKEIVQGLGLVALGRLVDRSEEHTSELQSRENLVCRLLLE